MAATHYGCHDVSGAALLAAIDLAVAAGVSGAHLHLVSTANGQQIAVVGEI